MDSCGKKRSRIIGSEISGKLNPESIRLKASDGGCQSS